MATDEDVFPWEALLWSIVVATLLRARHLLNQQRFLRALAEVPLAYLFCMAILNWLLEPEHILPGPVGFFEDHPQSAEQSHIIEAGDCMREYHSAAEVLAAVRRTEVCTLVVLGAKWDGHYKLGAARRVERTRIGNMRRSFNRRRRLSLRRRLGRSLLQ